MADVAVVRAPERPAGPVASLGVAAVLVAVGLATAAVAWTAPEGDWPTQALLLAVVAMVLTGLAAVTVMRTIARTPPLSAGTIWAGYFVGAFGVASLAWLSGPPLSAAEVTARSVLAGVLVSFAAMMAWAVGYVLNLLHPLARALRGGADWAFPSRPSPMRSKHAPLLLYAFGTAARALEVAMGRFGYFQDAGAAITSPSPWQQLVSVLDGLTKLGLVLAALDAACFSRTRRSKMVLVALLALEGGVGMLSASKESVLLALLTVAGVYVGSVGRIRWPLAALCLVAVVFVFSVNSAYRAELRSGPGGRVPIDSVIHAFPRALRSTFAPDPLRAARDGLARAASRVRQVDNVALIVEKTPSQISFEPWEALAYGPAVGVVPRALWPSKPVLSTGLEFSRRYYDIPESVVTASAITTPGDLYRHGGLVPVALGMLILGAAARAIDTVFSAGRDPRRLLVLVPLIVVLAKSESDFVTLVLTLGETTVLALSVARLVFVRDRAASARPLRP